MESETKNKANKRKKLLYPKTIEEAVDSLNTFFDFDMWHAKTNWKTEKDMRKYLQKHFDSLREVIKDVINEQKIAET